MKNLRQTIVMALFAFGLPVASVVALNWNEVRPYLIGDPDIAEGRMLYFATMG